MMTLHTFKGFVDGARDAYLHAVEKHPQFAEHACRDFGHGLSIVQNILRQIRKDNDAKGRKGKPLVFSEILGEELYEYYEASLLGDHEAAKRELLDCAAVLMMEWERISK